MATLLGSNCVNGCLWKELAHQGMLSYDANNKFLILSRMRNSLRQLGVVALLITLSLGLMHVVSPEVLAQGVFGVDRQIVPTEIQTATGGETSIINLVRTILNYFLGFLGILCIAIVIYGGFMYVTAGINEDNASTGKNILTYAAIGILIILLSFVIVNTLLQAAVPGATGQ
jgi:hypothetical protein